MTLIAAIYRVFTTHRQLMYDDARSVAESTSWERADVIRQVVMQHMWRIQLWTVK